MTDALWLSKPNNPSPECSQQILCPFEALRYSYLRLSWSPSLQSWSSRPNTLGAAVSPAGWRTEGKRATHSPLSVPPRRGRCRLAQHPAVLPRGGTALAEFLLPSPVGPNSLAFCANRILECLIESRTFAKALWCMAVCRHPLQVFPEHREDGLRRVHGLLLFPPPVSRSFRLFYPTPRRAGLSLGALLYSSGSHDSHRRTFVHRFMSGGHKKKEHRMSPWCWLPSTVPILNFLLGLDLSLKNQVRKEFQSKMEPENRTRRILRMRCQKIEI